MKILTNGETGGHGGDLKEAARQAGADPAALVDFSSNINPLGPPPGLWKHLSAHLEEISRYPVPQARELRAALAGELKLPAGRLLVGNGANELIHLLFLYLRPCRVLLPAPSFSEYYRAAVLAGARVEWFSLAPGSSLDGAAPADKLSGFDLVVLCNPNNPTGTCYSRETLLSIVAGARERGVQVMLDESFLFFTGRDDESLREAEAENLWVITSLTKLWALPGLRLGYAAGPSEAVKKLTGWGDPWRVNVLAQRAGLYCLPQKEYLKKTLALVEKERAYLHRALLKTGAFHVFKGEANFLLAQGLDPLFDVEDLERFLVRRGVLIRRADNFPGLDKRYFRIAVRRRPENRRLLHGLEEYLKSAGAGREGSR